MDLEISEIIWIGKGRATEKKAQDLMNSFGYDKNITPEEKKSIKASTKEEIGALFELKDIDIAAEGWTQWFGAAKSSPIPQLVKFAE